METNTDDDCRQLNQLRVDMVVTSPDLKDVFASAHEHAERTASTGDRRGTDDGSTGGDHGGAGTGVSAAPTVTSVLLRHGIMPDYRAVESSRDCGEAYAARLARERDGAGGGGGVPDRLALPQSPGGAGGPAPSGGGGAPDDEAGEHVVALHAMFSGFCHPPPSYGGVAGAYALERARVRSLAETEGGGGLDAAGYLAGVPLNR